MKRSFDNIKNQKSRLRYDFLPPMQEIIERPSNKLGTFIIWLILVIMITALVWAYNFKLDIVVSANGHIVPENRLAIIKAETTGNIQEIYVGESDAVVVGDPILSIDQSEIQLQLDKFLMIKIFWKFSMICIQRLAKMSWLKTQTHWYMETMKTLQNQSLLSMTYIWQN